MHFHYVSLFPDMIRDYFKYSILNKALENNLINISFFNPRDYSNFKHLNVDDTVIGGGAGMLMMLEPLYNCLKDLNEEHPKNHIIFTSPCAKPFKQNDAKRLSKKTNISFVCGRYEGIDERVIEEFADEVFSLGDYILTGGELASLAMSDAISRNIEGVLGNSLSLEEESFEDLLLEAPKFTKPRRFKDLCVSSEFLKGNHSKITDLKDKMSLLKTKYYRPDNAVLYLKRIKYEK